MKAKILIQRLQEIVDKHGGDLDVDILTENEAEDVEKVALAEVTLRLI